ncbi:conserved hypothetical protein [Hyella patelloides LEGE 07179]|uniref:Chromosome segregation ATPase n=1 Tax=Hyella patelloides LEGE 07179 TaxID=945734 RepID=A0A563VJD3_9CYAN|nr:chromosome segregation ATPase [Hyella patelloides]VEP11548.1 conserved hypothetical protein [Hyella patelloides LEGE 07179]
MASKQKPNDFNYESRKNSSSRSSQRHSPLNADGNYGEVNSFARREQYSTSERRNVGSGSHGNTLQVTSSSRSTESQPQPSNRMTTKSSRKNRWWQTWQFWGILLVLCSGGIGYGATSMLLRLPKTQSCSKVFWPVASASVRLYCAQSLAEDKTVGSLLEAIALVEELPVDHPLRNEINRNVEKWANAILAIGETKFQEGNLEAAVAIARQIPENVEARSVVESQIESWNQIWAEADNNYTKVEDNLRQAQWGDAFSWAVRLTDSKNDYWATTKYSETIDKINLAQEESLTLDKAANQLSGGDLDSLLDAIAKAKDIPENSYRYENAQDILAQGKEQLLARIDSFIEQRKWSQLQRVTYRIPAILELEEQVKDWQILANAGSSASLDTVLGLEDAIAEIAELEPTSPLYSKAQQLSERWTMEIDDVRRISKAKELARPANIRAYNAAIVEINQIPANNPRYREAQQKAAEWGKEIQIIEDRPIIRKAEELALPGDTMAWRRAISEISLVSSSSPLYSEANKKARAWQANIEREEDRPILEQAISLGNQRDYQQAIAVARKISQGRALSSQAQKKIALWRDEVQAKEFLEEANYLANQNDSDSLVKAIRIIRQIPSSTDVYYEVVPNVNSWSQQILVLAERASYRSLEDGIAIAKKVPSGTGAYPAAQAQIERWQNRLNPSPSIEKREKSNSDIQLEKDRKEN